MANKIFNYAKYSAALQELWAKRVSDKTIAEVMGLGNGIISRYRRSFNLPHVAVNTKSAMSLEDIKQVFVKHGCADFSKEALYSGLSTTLLVSRETQNVFDTRKIINTDFFNPDTSEKALELFVYYNLYAPKCRIVQYLDEVFLRYHKKPLSKESIKSLYTKALSMWEAQTGFAYRFADPVFHGEETISELFLLYLIVHFAFKAKNKNCNPKFISKYCEFIYESSPIKQGYLAELYAMLGIAIRDDDYVPSDDVFKEERILINNRESDFFVPFPFMYSKGDVFTLPTWAAAKYETWLKAHVSESAQVFSTSATEESAPVSSALKDFTPVKVKKTRTVKKPEVAVQESESSVIPISDPIEVEQNVSSDSVMKTQDTLISSLRDNAIQLAIAGNDYLAASLLYIIHAEKNGIGYHVSLDDLNHPVDK